MFGGMCHPVKKPLNCIIYTKEHVFNYVAALKKNVYNVCINKNAQTMQSRKKCWKLKVMHWCLNMIPNINQL